MKFLLHTCCADCLLRYLEITGCRPQNNTHLKHGAAPFSPNPADHLNLADITLYFYNPNLYPKAEYQARLKALKGLAELYELPLMVADYQPQDYFELNPPQPPFPETPKRCAPCWQLRLAKTAAFAKDFNQEKEGVPFTHYSTTLLVSQYQSAPELTAIGQSLTTPRLQFFAPNTTPAPTFKTSGFYKQNYCGCLFSLLEKTTQKY